VADTGFDAGSFATGGSAAIEIATKPHANNGTQMKFRGARDRRGVCPAREPA
jgi:hypothetical protein